LRERSEDILLLAEHFLAEARRRGSRQPPISGLTQHASRALLAYGWPGNVRELQNVIERALALAQGTEIDVDDLPPQLRARRASDLLAGAVSRQLSLAEVEREYIEKVLASEGGNKSRAAQRLGLDRKTLYRKLDEYARADGKPPDGDRDDDGA
jgi:two-component system response regulator HydG